MNAVIAAAVSAITTAAVLVPVSTSPPASRSMADATRLERRVSELERRSRAQVAFNVVTLNRLSSLEGRDVYLTTGLTQSTSIAPRSWGYVSATCLFGGTLIGGGFEADFPVEMGQAGLSGEGLLQTWRVAAFNPYLGGNVRVSARAHCVTVR